jgi:sRNA-binding carbon storage regulator CsrA
MHEGMGLILSTRKNQSINIGLEIENTLKSHFKKQEKPNIVAHS